MMETTERRLPTWSRIGTDITPAHSVDEILSLSGLDYTVEKQPIFLPNGKRVPNKFATVSTTGNVFGIVGPDYTVVQNQDGFKFIDSLADVSFERAGQTTKGLVWIIAKLNERTILGDNFSTYAIFQNSHDGNSMLKATISPLRMLCQNQFNIAFKKSQNRIGLRHTVNAEARLHQAQGVLQGSMLYMDHFADTAVDLSKLTLTKAQAERIVNEIFPLPAEASNRVEESIVERRNTLLNIYKTNDLQSRRSTAWGMLNAYTDMITHAEPRKTALWEETKFLATTIDLPIDKVLTLIRDKAA